MDNNLVDPNGNKITDINDAPSKQEEKEEQGVIPNTAVLVALLPDGSMGIIPNVEERCGIKTERTMKDEEVAPFLLEAAFQALRIVTNRMMNMLLERNIGPINQAIAAIQSEIKIISKWRITEEINHAGDGVTAEEAAGSLFEGAEISQKAELKAGDPGTETFKHATIPATSETVPAGSNIAPDVDQPE